MSEEKHRVEVFFDDYEYAILEELSTGTKWSIEKLVHEAVFHAHFTEETKKRHEAFRWMLTHDPVDLYSEWKKMKEWLEKDWAWKIDKSYDQFQESP